VSLEAIEIETGAKPEATVIWLHGLGADGHDFEPIVPELGLPASKPVRFIFPHAPIRPVTLNMGMPMRAWYDILQLGGGAEDDDGIRASQLSVENLIKAENKRGIKSEKIVLAGFSQGGAIVLQTGLRYPEPLAGIMALSTYLPLSARVVEERHAKNQGIPIFMAHGEHDNMIPVERAQSSREALEALGYKVQWHTYPMPHSVCPEEIGDMARFLLKIL
jgi:phospholipase/carboxylesterase